jgi:hypothetical protein
MAAPQQPSQPLCRLPQLAASVAHERHLVPDGSFQPCVHQTGCAYLPAVLADVADVMLACGAVCFDRMTR